MSSSARPLFCASNQLNRRLAAWICALSILLLLISATPRKSYGQVLYGTITGRITDPSGAPVPNAKVEAINTGTAVSRQATTDGRGMYIFTHLLPGTYRIRVSAPSFQPSSNKTFS